MRAMIILIIFGSLLLIGGFIFLNIKNLAPAPTSLDNPTVTRNGVIRPTAPTLEYSYMLVLGDTGTPVTSRKVDFKIYVNKPVSVVGQFSGTTLYVDQIKEQP